MPGLPLAPPTASTAAGRMDALFYFLLGGSVLITLAIFIALAYFLVRYRRRPGNEMAQREGNTLPIELGWIVGLTLLSVIPFVWGAYLYLDLAKPPSDAMEVYVVAKQWMWKAQHPDGQAEIDELHVPVGRAVRLLMTSQDVIHDFSVPAFRVKQDVLPGRYTTMWFQATQAGEFHLFCAEYCGLDHSGMVGRIVALEPAEFEAWLQTGAFLSPAAEGRKLFEQYGCVTCHEGNRAPRLEGVFGRPQLMSDGQTVVADESYIRESILNPSARVVYGFEPIMPTFNGLLDETQLIQLVTYIKSIGLSLNPSTGEPGQAPLPGSIRSGAP
ncbi:MAG TPA: cytochrome c oxidase subunit II [Chloroflexota bacterium]|jgi:cytochrome c oxidase subunit II|nr:cytochrome c oxidase subunit II [Chloroflexota bacterium]